MDGFYSPHFLASFLFRNNENQQEDTNVQNANNTISRVHSKEVEDLEPSEDYYTNIGLADNNYPSHVAKPLDNNTSTFIPTEGSVNKVSSFEPIFLSAQQSQSSHNNSVIAKEASSTTKPTKVAKKSNNNNNKKVARKQCLQSGKEHTNSKGKLVQAKKFNYVDCNCRLKCTDILSFEERKKIFEGFWSMGDWQSQTVFIVTNVKMFDIKKRTTNVPNNRNYHREFNLNYKRVCKRTFLSSLGISDHRLDYALRIKSKDGFVAPDQRGGHHYHKTSEPVFLQPGKEHTNSKGKLVQAKKYNHVDCNCRLKCTERLTLEERKNIFDGFWSMGNWQSQAVFIVSSVKMLDIKRRSANVPSCKHRQYRREFTLNDKRICKKSFLATLGITHHKLDYALKIKNKEGFVPPDKRGGHHYSKTSESSQCLQSGKKKKHTKSKGKQNQAKKYNHIECNCRLKCIEKLSFEERKHIFEGFWSMANWQSQTVFIVNNVKMLDIKRRTTSVPNSRNFHREFYLNNKRICKRVFLTALGISNQRLDYALRKKSKDGFVTPDKRGRSQ